MWCGLLLALALTQSAHAQCASQEKIGVWVEKLGYCSTSFGSRSEQCERITTAIKEKMKALGVAQSPERAKYFVRFQYERVSREISSCYEGNVFGRTLSIRPCTWDDYAVQIYWTEDPRAVAWETEDKWLKLTFIEYMSKSDELTAQSLSRYGTCLDHCNDIYFMESDKCLKKRGDSQFSVCSDKATNNHDECNAQCKQEVEAVDEVKRQLYEQVDVINGRSVRANMRSFLGLQDICNPIGSQCEEYIVVMLQRLIEKHIVQGDPCSAASSEKTDWIDRERD
ncbi:MAG: hypothetical protein L0338_04930 [Acidobacteria bacterium]|nr:hypothetical protein [Acidobacteriota bacterium]